MTGTARATDAARPNVLLIMADEWRARSVGYAGDEHARTPHIDALAAESVTYQQAISGQPICCPARASFLTGQYPLQHGVYLNDVPLQPTGPVLPEVFRDHGYRTGYIGKWHLFGSPEGTFERRESYIPAESRFGFEYWKALECTHDYNRSAYYEGDDPAKRFWEGYDAFAQTEDAIGFITDAGETPFFLTLSYGPPHFPLHTAPERYRELYADADIQPPANVPDWCRDEAVNDLRGYYAHIAALDECVGRLLDAVGENTVVVFTSDHGDMLWSQGLEHKLVPWEESVRVPLLVRAPGRAPRTSQQLFNSPDLMPTLLGYAGLPVPPGVTGADLSVPEAGTPSAFLCVPAAYSSLRRAGLEEYRGVRDQRYTYVRTRSGPWLLYDNIDDPQQLRNRCGDPALAAEQDRLDQELDRWLTRLGDEFLPGEEYLGRDGYQHYFEANEPLGCSGTDQWQSTNGRGRFFSVDTQLSAVLAHPDARAVVEELGPRLLEAGEPLHDRRSVRLLAMCEPAAIIDERLKELDRRLTALGTRPVGPEGDVALPAWP
ncbi:sulfatase, partial [Phytoactinopolyspora endophytica]|uniref:sulfatase family protein n=1 Tax=Phytoactinopolyspora endophytica TaxID=1642495 RepID=UPI00197C6A9C